jgi:hypothetical protein
LIGSSLSWFLEEKASEYKKREGHSKVSKAHKEDGANLSVWLSTPRHLKNTEKLDLDRETRLEGIGFECAASETWDEMYALLKQSEMREGHCNLPFSHEGGATLGAWVSRRQRHLKKTRKPDLDRDKLLEETGFEWAIEVPWDETFTLLKQFKKHEGRCNAPQSHKEGGANLKAWVDRQRQLRRQEKLDLE